MKKHVQENGYIVFNNHLHTGNLKYKISRLLNRRTNKGMYSSEVESLLKECGLKIVKTYHVCVVPLSENHILLPVFYFIKLNILYTKIKLFGKYAENIIYVCCKSE